MKRQSFLLSLTVLMFINGFIVAQQDSIQYHNMRVFKIADGKKTDAFFVKNQKTYTIDGQLIREITFDDSTKKILNYTFYFYKNGKLVSEENHDRNDSILYIILHKYDSKDREIETSRLEWIKGKMKTSERTMFVYDKAGTKIAKKESGSRKKPFRITNYIYTLGNLVREQARATKPSDNAVERITEYKYGQDGKVALKKILEKNVVDTVIIQTETYLYNPKGQMITNEVKDPQGKVVLSKNYEYYADGSIRNYYERDGAGKLFMYHTFIIKRHKINLGTQKSYFDKK